MPGPSAGLLSSLKLLEDHEWKIRQERKAKEGETKESE
jgi:hypothetical protein